jgi:glycosyltransferase involved in cell wall biosynthesis
MAGTGMKSNSKKIENSGVLFLGELTTVETLHDLYRSLHIIIICSEYEGFPMVLMESMPFGTVPICTDVGGISEHITHNQNGKLIPNDTNELLAAFYEAIKSLLEDKKSLKLLSNNASNYACENFDILNFNTSYNNLLN